MSSFEERVACVSNWFASPRFREILRLAIYGDPALEKYALGV